MQSHLPDKKKKCEELLGKVKKLEADYAKMPEGTEEEKIAKKVAGQHLAEMESEADNDLLDITALIGGLYLKVPRIFSFYPEDS